MARVCKACGVEKPLEDFVKDSRKSEGRAWTCKKCRGRYLKKWAASETGNKSLKAYRVNRRDKHAEECRKWRRNNPEAASRASRKWVAANPEKRRAHILVQHAMSRGILKRLPCDICGATEQIDAHHDDYSKPLDVRWLCHKCHISTLHAA